MTDLLADEADQEDDDQSCHGDAAGEDDEGRAHDLLHEVSSVEDFDLHGVVQNLTRVVWKFEKNYFTQFVLKLMDWI